LARRYLPRARNTGPGLANAPLLVGSLTQRQNEGRIP